MHQPGANMRGTIAGELARSRNGVTQAVQWLPFATIAMRASAANNANIPGCSTAVKITKGISGQTFLPSERTVIHHTNILSDDITP